MQIKLIAVGKVKEKFHRAALAEYAKRLSRFCKLQQIELADERAPEKLSPAEMAQVKRREGQRILQKIGAGDYVISLEIDGQQLTSEDFAKKLDDLAIAGRSQICLVIGGSLGLSREVRQRSDYALSFGHMTLPHQLIRVVLLEQVYRAFKINRGQPYHK